MTICCVHPASVGDGDQRQQLGFVAAATQFQVPEPFRDRTVIESHQFIDEIGEHDPRIAIICTRNNQKTYICSKINPGRRRGYGGAAEGIGPRRCPILGGSIMTNTLLPTTLVGSYAMPDWLIDREKLASRFPPRTRARELWRVDPEFLEEAQDDATLLAIRDQERAGVDIVTDGEMRRESYSNRFATALDGVDIDNPGTALDRSGHPNPVPRVVGPIRRRHPVEVRDVEFLRANTDRRIKITVPGPFTMSQQAQNDHYDSLAEMSLDYAVAVNEEIQDLFAAGADIVQVDEPYLQARPAAAEEYGLEALNRALLGIAGETVVHLCFGYAAIIHERPEGYSFLPQLAQCTVDSISIETAQSGLDCSVLAELPDKTMLIGVLDLSTHDVESPDVVAARIRRALVHHPAEQVVVAPDCGLKYLPRDVAFGKMCAMVDGANDRARRARRVAPVNDRPDRPDRSDWCSCDSS